MLSGSRRCYAHWHVHSSAVSHDLQLHGIPNLMLVEQAVKIICVSNLFAVHAKDNISDCKITILGLRDSAKPGISCRLTRCNLQYDHAVCDWQLKLTLEWLDVACANTQFWSSHFARLQ